MAPHADRRADYRHQGSGGRLSGAVVTGPAWSGRGLRLLVPATVEHAADLADLADLAVDAERNISGMELDYTPVSLSRVDEILDRFRPSWCSAAT